MNKEEFLELLNSEYDKFKSSGLSLEQHIKKRKDRSIAIELKTKERIAKLNKRQNRPVKQLSCLHFYGKQYESFEKELTYYEDYARK
jgi:hypothetical protein